MVASTLELASGPSPDTSYISIHHRTLEFESASFDFDISEATTVLAIKASSPRIPTDCFSRLPKEVLKMVLHSLLVSTEPLILGLGVERPPDSSTGLDPIILRSCHYLYNIGIEVLYS